GRGDGSATCAARPMRFDGRKIRLYLFKSGEIGNDLCHLLGCGGAVSSDNMVVIVFRALVTGYIDVDEGAKTIVLAEVAARIFIACCAIVDVGNGLKADKSSRSSIAPETQRLLSCADCAGFAAVLVNNN